MQGAMYYIDRYFLVWMLPLLRKGERYGSIENTASMITEMYWWLLKNENIVNEVNDFV